MPSDSENVEWHRLAFLRQHYRQGANSIEVVTSRIGQAHGDIEPSVAFEYDPCLAPAERGRDGVGHVLQCQAVTRNGVTVELDVELREALSLLNLHVRRAGDGIEDRSDLCPERTHFLQIVAIEFDRDVATHARDQFVEPQLDRLADLESAADQRLELGFEPFDHLVLGVHTVGPLVFGFQDNERVRDIGGHRIGANLRRAGLRIHEGNFGQARHRLLNLHLQGE